jgi:hypothetical protein
VSQIRAATSLIIRHRLFCAALLMGLTVRVITMLAFPPAFWFGGDSASYLGTALWLAPAQSRMSGYGIFLALLRPFHNVAVATACQHLMGLLIAVMIYALLRRYGLPAWGATLAALPFLVDAYQIQVEHEILPTAPFGFLVVCAVALVLWWRHDRPLWATAGAGLLLGLAATLWPVGLPLLIIYVAGYLTVRGTGWRMLAATAAAGALPLVGYLGWFDASQHQLAFSDSDGIYLWSRTMTFANCAIIKPTAAEVALCAAEPVSKRPAASSFIWKPNSPLNRVPGPTFSASKNALAMRFALRAIIAQPGGYAADVLQDVALSFTWDRAPHPSRFILRRYEFSYATHHWISPSQPAGHDHTIASDQRAYGATPTRAVEPFAGWMRAYQRSVYLRGTLLGIILLIGLAGIVRAWARGSRGLHGWGGPGLYPWANAIALLVVPVMTADFGVRYVLLAMPLACLAAGLTFAPAAAGANTGARPGAPREAIAARRAGPSLEPAGGPAHQTALSSSESGSPAPSTGLGPVPDQLTGQRLAIRRGLPPRPLAGQRAGAGQHAARHGQAGESDKGHGDGVRRKPAEVARQRVHRQAAGQVQVQRPEGGYPHDQRELVDRHDDAGRVGRLGYWYPHQHRGHQRAERGRHAGPGQRQDQVKTGQALSPHLELAARHTLPSTVPSTLDGTSTAL